MGEQGQHFTLRDKVLATGWELENPDARPSRGKLLLHRAAAAHSSSTKTMGCGSQGRSPSESQEGPSQNQAITSDHESVIRINASSARSSQGKDPLSPKKSNFPPPPTMRSDPIPESVIVTQRTHPITDGGWSGLGALVRSRLFQCVLGRLIGDLPRPPLRSWIGRRDGACPIRHRVAGIGDILTVLGAARSGRIKRKRSVTVKIEIRRSGIRGRPCGVLAPGVRSSLECGDLPLRRIAFSVQVIPKERGLDILPKFQRCFVTPSVSCGQETWHRHAGRTERITDQALTEATVLRKE
jgi:hypothetical protein